MKNSLKRTPSDVLEGTIHKTTNNGNIIIIEYLNTNNVAVKFVGYAHKVTTTANCIRIGKVKNFMLPVVCTVGFTGLGNYSKLKDKKAYQTWNGMLERCYSKKSLIKNPTYNECSVCIDWHNFQTFAKWFYECSGYIDGMHLDKDIILQGNKVYSPSMCVFVSQEVNTLLVDRKAKRGSCMLGVSKINNRYMAQCNTGKGKQKNLGTFTTENAAHKAYKDCKYMIIRKIAEQQSNVLIKNSLLSWVIPEY